MNGIKKPSSALLAASTIMASSAMVTPAWAETRDGYYGHGMMWNGGWNGMFFGPVMMIIFFTAVVVLVAVGVRWVIGRGPKSSHPETGLNTDKALDILKQRYARGEIDEEEFQDKKRHLSD